MKKKCPNRIRKLERRFKIIDRSICLKENFNILTEFDLFYEILSLSAKFYNFRQV